MHPTHAFTLATFLACAGGVYAQEPFDQTFRPDVVAPDGFGRTGPRTPQSWTSWHRAGPR